MQRKSETAEPSAITKVAQAGSQVYEKIKGQYEPQDNGKWLAIEPKSEAVAEGETSSEAVERARHAHPDRLFYVVKVGHAAAETLSGFGLSNV